MARHTRIGGAGKPQGGPPPHIQHAPYLKRQAHPLVHAHRCRWLLAHLRAQSCTAMVGQIRIFCCINTVQTPHVRSFPTGNKVAGLPHSVLAHPKHGGWTPRCIQHGTKHGACKTLGGWPAQDGGHEGVLSSRQCAAVLEIRGKGLEMRGKGHSCAARQWGSANSVHCGRDAAGSRRAEDCRGWPHSCPGVRLG